MERKAQTQEKGIFTLHFDLKNSRLLEIPPSCLYALPPAGPGGGVHTETPGAGGLLQDERGVGMP